MLIALNVRHDGYGFRARASRAAEDDAITSILVVFAAFGFVGETLAFADEASHLT
jgi:hypothetical protein